MSVVIYTHVIDTDRGRSLDNLEITIVEALEHARATHFRSIEKWAERESRGVEGPVSWATRSSIGAQRTGVDPALPPRIEDGYKDGARPCAVSRE
ncbi:hypothetical protein ACIA74_38780 [Streptomyces sp. NPDC051658]|uniref:hypothetical protein n=1 Tax=Streptomyces sp. NPDC051658 TaxID=3365667 RepID=UPI00378DE38A